MEIRHRISFNAKHGVTIAKRLAALGVKLKGVDSKDALLLHFDIGENDLRWGEVKKLLGSAGIGTLPEWTEFTDHEIGSAEWVQIVPAYIWGYPMPDSDGNWKSQSFFASEECRRCGIGLKQKGPIHLKGEPAIQDNDFMGIFWTYPIFAKPHVFDILQGENIRGFEMVPAINHVSNAHLRTVQQLKITEELPPCIIEDNLSIDDRACGHRKYRGLSRGMYKVKRTVLSDRLDLALTSEWFGSGHAAYPLALASARFVKVYRKRDWHGLFLNPIELV